MKESIDDKKLTGDYQTTYFDIMCYLQSCDIDSNFYKEVKDDLKDMFVSAQKDKISINNITGKDIKSFCEDIIQSYTTKKHKILTLLKSFNLYLVIIMFISLIFGILKVSLNLNIFAVLLLNMFVFKYTMNYFYKKLSLKYTGLKNKIKCILLIAIVSLLVFLPLDYIIIIYCNLLINGFYTSIICLLGFLVIHIICKYLNKNFGWHSYFK